MNLLLYIEGEIKISQQVAPLRAYFTDSYPFQNIYQLIKKPVGVNG